MPKIAFIGENINQAIGKTSLIRKILNPNTKRDPRLTPQKSSEIPVKDGYALWNTPGDKASIEDTLPDILSNTSAVVYCINTYELTGENIAPIIDSINLNIETINQRAPNVPVLLVVTQFDSIGEQDIQTAHNALIKYIQSMSNCSGPYYCSAYEDSTQRLDLKNQLSCPLQQIPTTQLWELIKEKAPQLESDDAMEETNTEQIAQSNPTFGISKFLQYASTTIGSLALGAFILLMTVTAAAAFATPLVIIALLGTALCCAAITIGITLHQRQQQYIPISKPTTPKFETNAIPLAQSIKVHPSENTNQNINAQKTPIAHIKQGYT